MMVRNKVRMFCTTYIYRDWIHCLKLHLSVITTNLQMSQISTKLLEHFSNDFAQLLETEYEYNVIVKVGNQHFKLHSLILYQRSSFFRKELSTATKKNNIIEITLAHISIESFKIDTFTLVKSHLKG
ncbi:hypothetical protein C2G38_1031752 [Gigaspora rosea]|uniref:BTB domain-containing protein n=1 Tax=Gigaspora rosea TaxID=44941 RepID=A0A397VJP1_9GLOM|nr:hypothetical protein C2G38_1031752 [Gigaspora rosea]